VTADPGRYPADDLRLSDADRDRAVTELSEHFQAGRLTAEEFDERSGQALRARTGKDLAVLLADLPAKQAPETSPVASAESAQPSLHHRRPAASAALVALVVVAAVVALHSGNQGHGGLLALLPLLVVLLVVRRLAGGGRRRGR
jgi:lipopolysaccharide export LptBFGC system permease protein LptF